MLKKDFDEINDLWEEGDDEIVASEESKQYEHYRYIADKGQSLLRIDKFLSDRIEGVSRNRIQQAAEAGCILVNNVPVKSSYKVKPMDVISIVMDKPRHEIEIIPEDIPLNIVYEDNDLMVVNKPAGMVVHPGYGNYTGTLLNAVAYYLNYEQGMHLDDPRVGMVHRIDKDTSGLLLIAKTPEAKTNLSLQFYNKTTTRQYVALVWGDPKDDEGRIEGNIGRDPKNRMLMRVFPDGEMGKAAVTHYKVLERFEYVTLVQCQLETGRTHQIRVHMKEAKHPLTGDETYGNPRHPASDAVKEVVKALGRQALHAFKLSFKHPKTGEEVSFQAALPADIHHLLSVLRLECGKDSALSNAPEWVDTQVDDDDDWDEDEFDVEVRYVPD